MAVSSSCCSADGKNFANLETLGLVSLALASLMLVMSGLRKPFASLILVVLGAKKPSDSGASLMPVVSGAEKPLGLGRPDPMTAHLVLGWRRPSVSLKLTSKSGVLPQCRALPTWGLT